MMVRTLDTTWFALVAVAIAGMFVSAVKVTHFGVVKIDGQRIILSLKPAAAAAFQEYLDRTRV